MAYHPQTIRALRVYQACQRDRLQPYPAADAADDYAGAVEFQAGEPAGLYASPVELIRRHTRKRVREALLACRAARAGLATGVWQGENAPLCLASAQADLWRARDYRRAYIAAAAAHAMPAPAMVEQPCQQQQARHAFEAVQVEGPGREAILDRFTVTKRRTADAAYHAADALCDQARAMPHKPAAFVREVNAPASDIISDNDYRNAAQAAQTAGAGIEIDEDAKVSRSESGGAYVQAWVWVSNDETRT